MYRLEQDQRLFHRDDIVDAHLDGDSLVSTQPVTFWCIPSVTEEEIKAAKEKAVQSFCGILQRKTLKGKVCVCVWKEV